MFNSRDVTDFESDRIRHFFRYLKSDGYLKSEHLAEMEPGLRVTGSPGQQFGSGSGRVTGQSSDPDFDPGSCSMPISHTLCSSTEFGY